MYLLGEVYAAKSTAAICCTLQKHSTCVDIVNYSCSSPTVLACLEVEFSVAPILSLIQRYPFVVNGAIEREVDSSGLVCSGKMYMFNFLD